MCKYAPVFMQIYIFRRGEERALETTIMGMLPIEINFSEKQPKGNPILSVIVLTQLRQLPESY